MSLSDVCSSLVNRGGGGRDKIDGRPAEGNSMTQQAVADAASAGLVTSKSKVSGYSQKRSARTRRSTGRVTSGTC
jgi:hypothetical protein